MSAAARPVAHNARTSVRSPLASVTWPASVRSAIVHGAGGAPDLAVEAVGRIRSPHGAALTTCGSPAA